MRVRAHPAAVPRLRGAARRPQRQPAEHPRRGGEDRGEVGPRVRLARRAGRPGRRGPGQGRRRAARAPGSGGAQPLAHRAGPRRAAAGHARPTSRCAPGTATPCTSVFDTLQFRVLRDRLYQTLEAAEPEADEGFERRASSSSGPVRCAAVARRARQRRCARRGRGRRHLGTRHRRRDGARRGGGRRRRRRGSTRRRSPPTTTRRWPAGWRRPTHPRRCTTPRARCSRSPRAAGRWPASPATPRCPRTSRCPGSARSTWPTWRCGSCTASCASEADDNGQLSLDGSSTRPRPWRRWPCGPRAVRDLADVLDVELEAKGQTPLLRDVELPLVGVLADMERAGIAVDAEHLADLQSQFAGEVKAAAQEAYAVVGREFNLGLAQAAAGDPVRRARPAEDQADQDRLHHRRRRAAGAVRADRAPAARAPAAPPRRVQAARHRRGAAEVRRRRRPHPHHVQPDRRGDRPAVVDRPQPAEHPDPHRGGPHDPAGVRRRAAASSR